MTQFNTPAYDVERPTLRCAFTGRKLEPGEAYVATLVEVDEQPTESAGAGSGGGLGLRRLDVSMEAWQAGSRPEREFSHWRSRVPEPNQKKRLFVDDEVLVNLFRRLADADQAQRVAFRFVVALILMRKKLLRYEGSFVRKAERPASADPPLPVADEEVWRMTLKGEAEAVEVVNPRLDEAQIGQVTQQLGEVLEGEL
jgi:hypothetical protein